VDTFLRSFRYYRRLEGSETELRKALNSVIKVNKYAMKTYWGSGGDQLHAQVELCNKCKVKLYCA
jgi:hypothetical protein